MEYEQIKDFVGLTDCSQGYSMKELLQAEQQLNRLLPVNLRKYYQCFGKDVLLTNAFHRLVAPLDIILLNGYLVFYEENQGVWIAGIPVEKLSAKDISVWLTYDNGQNWEKFCDKLSEFLVSMSFFQLLEGWGYVAVKEGVEKNIIKRIFQYWQELEGTCSQVNTVFFSNPSKSQLLGITIEPDSNSEQEKTYYLQIATSTQKDYEQVMTKLGIDNWDYSSLYG